eukprot:gb/GEZN01010640.1/.p1 GENE.gb/GEZN01010640.1/~~gb/GEZN01010640.1/.p1  ORF type:complete len:370 (-),score=34.14 gb/GEZN01010640.1/:35-1144(-)
MQSHHVNLRGVKQLDLIQPRQVGPSFHRRLCLSVIIVLAVVFCAFSYVQLAASRIARTPSWKIKPAFELPADRRDLDEEDDTGLGPAQALPLSPNRFPALKPLPNVVGSDRKEVRELQDANNTSGQDMKHVTGLQLSQPPQCLNTVQGAWMLTDNSGAVCERKDILTSGCCNVSKLTAFRTCEGCREDLGCCNSYEHCVSCCLSHKPTPTRNTLTYDHHVFDDCLHYCRLSSRSIKHGNLYKRDFLKFCYSDQVNISSLNLAHGTIIAGEFNRNCKTVCAQSKLSCIDEYLARLNDCDIVEKYLPCLTCSPSVGGSRGVYPSIVKANAPREDKNGLVPGVCYMNDEIDKSDCTSLHMNLRRLCFCLPHV